MTIFSREVTSYNSINNSKYGNYGLPLIHATNLDVRDLQ
jgi:hypothetical protein